MHLKMKLLAVTLLSLLVQVVTAFPTVGNIVTPEQVYGMREVAALHEAFQASGLPENATENGLSDLCRPVTMIFAKGTGENGNVGDGSSPGPAWFAEVRKVFGPENVTVQGVPYIANIEGYLMGGDPEGSERFLNITNDAAVKCPNTRLVIGGYSQGAQLAHNAADQFSPNLTSRIAAAVVFGDPFTKKPIGGIPSVNVMDICHDGDVICKRIGGAAAHLTYSQDAPEAASFVMKKLKLNLDMSRVQLGYLLD